MLWELPTAGLFYFVYSLVRAAHGRTTDAADTAVAAANGRDIWDFERRIGMAWEHPMQGLFLAHPTALTSISSFYGLAHFMVTFTVLSWLLLRRPLIYRYWRNVLAATIALAVTVFALYPAMPPRLLPAGEGTVDALAIYGGSLSYEHGLMGYVANPYAAMPSLHLGWATWSAAALWAAFPAASRLVRLAIVAYPTLIYLAVIVTGTHYVIDGVAGIATVALAAALVRLMTATSRRIRAAAPWRTGAGLAGVGPPHPAAAAVVAAEHSAVPPAQPNTA